jgi:nucleoside-diphosphate-sugar epimerase
MSTILLTGATGFLGSNIAKVLLADGHRVVALKRRASSLHRLTGIEKDIAFYDLDALDMATPFKEQGRIDAVIHTATCYGRAGETAMQVFQANTAFPLQLLEAATFFNTDTFFNSDTILYPHLNAYALSKKQFADWGRQLASNDRIRFINIRLEHIYGPGDDTSKFTTWVLGQCLWHVPELALTAGEQQRDFVYIRDVVAAYAHLLQHRTALGQGFQELGIGSSKPIAVRHFVETAHRLSVSKTRLQFGALPYRDHEQMQSCADTTTLQALGWQCQTSLEQGLTHMIEEMK